MKLGMWLAAAAAAALPLAAQPQRLVNARLESQPAGASLESEFKKTLSSRPEPAWVGYDAPIISGHSLGCEYVVPSGGAAAGVIHLEPPGRMVILIRVEGGSVKRVRTVSPDCEIDAGGLPVRWFTNVSPAESVALLMGTIGEAEGESAVNAIGLHSDPAAGEALERLAGAGRPETVRARAAFWLAASGAPGRLERLRRALPTLPEAAVSLAISGLAANPAPEATDLLTGLARSSTSSTLRKRAINALARSRDPRAVAFLLEVLAR